MKSRLQMAPMHRKNSIKKKIFQVLLVISSLVLLSYNSYAQDTFIGVKASTSGAGLELERSFSDSFSARVGLNYFPYDYSGTEDDIEYDFELDLLTVGLMVDWHPFKGSFRLTGGALYNGNSLDAKAKSSANFDIGDGTYLGSEVGNLTGEIDFNNFAPYVGLGWNTAFGKDGNWGFIFELGVMFQGSPSVNLSNDGILANDPAFQAELAKEEQNLEDELDNFEYYPVVSIGVNYRF